MQKVKDTCVIMTYGEKMGQIFLAKLEDTCVAEPVDPQLSGPTVSNPHNAKELHFLHPVKQSHTFMCIMYIYKCIFHSERTKMLFCVCVLCVHVFWYIRTTDTETDKQANIGEKEHNCSSAVIGGVCMLEWR